MERHLPILFLALIAMNSASGSPSGAPASTCVSLTPSAGRHDANPQTTPSPFIVQVNKDSVDPEEAIELVISSPDPSRPFKGFLAVARSLDNQDDETPYGTFQIDQLGKSLDCNVNGNVLPASGVTHESRDFKTQVNARWIAPNRAGNYHILVTVVEEKQTFWVGIPSDKNITVGIGVPPTAVPPVTTSPATIPPVVGTPEEVYEGCGQTKGCFGIPSNCVSRKSCEILVTYVAESTTNLVSFQLTGKPTSDDDAYIAVGLSKDNSMGGDSVFGCTVSKDRIGVSEFFNTNDRDNQPVNGREEEVITSASGSVVDGQLFCSFKIRPSYTVVLLESSFSLLAERLYILLARGEYTGGYLNYHVTASDRDVSGEATLLSDKTVLGAQSKTLVHLHGAFMLIAWILCASSGVFTARYYKQDYSPIQPCGVEFWFAMHRTFMSLTALLTIAGFVLIFVHVGGYTMNSGTAEKYHPILGIIVTALMVLQVVLAFFRPDRSSKKRIIFNWIHWTTGNSAHIIAIACIFLANDLAKTGLNGNKSYWILLAVFIGYHLLLHVVMSIVTNNADRRMNVVNSKRAFTFGPLPSGTRDDEMLLRSSVGVFNLTRSAILALYIVGATVTSGGLLYLFVSS